MVIVRQRHGLVGTAAAIAVARQARSARQVNEAQLDAMQQQQAQQPQQAPSAAPDVTQELTKLAALKDQGIITEEEFAAKKKQLLGL